MCSRRGHTVDSRPSAADELAWSLGERLPVRRPPHAPARQALSLLSHITFYDNAVRRIDPDPHWVHRSVSINKTTPAWREKVFRGVLAQLHEMECCYPFDRIDVVVDANAENAFAGRLLRAAAGLTRLRVCVHRAPATLSHPFELAWQHRAHFEAASEWYSWAMYSEDDTMVPGVALRTLVNYSAAAKARGALLTFLRVVNDTAGRLFLADEYRRLREPTVKPLQLHSSRPADERLSRREAQQPTEFVVTRHCTYAAAWAYPRATMAEFMRSMDWRETAHNREHAAWGWHNLRIHGARGLKHCATHRGLSVQHLGASMDAYYRHPMGFNTVPASLALKAPLPWSIIIAAAVLVGMALGTGFVCCASVCM
jgi:hypothetical protein